MGFLVFNPKNKKQKLDMLVHELNEDLQLIN
jgi:hypothetical protein